MGVVKHVGGRCKRCYTCVRNCPVKAICVEGGEATVIEDLCISCGTCVRVCSQKAKQAEAHIDRVFQAFATGTEVVALIAPSFD
ncbi:MAG TPA: 4Fe-4S binding protein, partial [Candidatus Ozemobacteraceae bacterium]|nr:4Fe-4S binding protein [Candidatus Ozemobacteraceae bacterium]